MSITNGLTTLANLREYLRLQTNDTGDNTLLENIVTRISAEISKKCNRTFQSGSFTEYLRGNSSSKIRVKNYPITAIASVHIDSDRVFGSDTAIDAGDIIIGQETPGEVILNGGIFDWSDDIENVKIVYTAGYATIPYDLERACLQLCACEYLESSRLNNPVKGEQSFKDMRDSAWKTILNNYKAY